MKPRTSLSSIAAIVFTSASTLSAQTALPQATRDVRVQAIHDTATSELLQAREAARRNGWKVEGKDALGRQYGLVRSAKNTPIYYGELSVTSSLAANADKVHLPPYALTGASSKIAMWDSGIARLTHEALTPRLTGEPQDWYNAHATWVAGVMAAAPPTTHPRVRGIAGGTQLITSTWDKDRPEMMALGASCPEDANSKVVASNHSYGVYSGWALGTFSGDWVETYYFFGAWNAEGPTRESNFFGLYLQDAAFYDQIAYDLPYYTPVVAVGNDRADAVPAAGASFYRLDSATGSWVLEPAYDPTLHPLRDSNVEGGFDTVQPSATAKNVISVGAVNGGVTSGVRDLSKATMTAFSGWGPTDDGRIKPDVVATGAGVQSVLSNSDTGYSAFGANGTSFAAPVVTATVALLHDYNNRLFPGTMLRASTVRALIIHAADDLVGGAAKSGPDYSTGWGHVNTQAALDILTAQAEQPQNRRIREASLNKSTAVHNFHYNLDEAGPVRVTLSWTDPAGAPRWTLDDRTPVLVHDLDLRLEHVETGAIYSPWILDPANPAAPATTGDNRVDNVEQVLIPSAPAGEYIVRVGMKGTLGTQGQAYSFVVSGLTGDGSDPLFASVEEWQTLDD